MMDCSSNIKKIIMDSINTKNSVLNNAEIINAVQDISDKIVNTLKNRNKILICGNGGSASDALHMAGEIVGRFQKERKAWPAIALNADVASMTAIANDYSYDEIFSRGVEAYANDGDVLVGISTSGNSKNVCNAIEKAKKLNVYTVGLSGKDGGNIAKIADTAIVVPSNVTARIQECHIMLIHIICELIEEKMLNE